MFLCLLADGVISAYYLEKEISKLKFSKTTVTLTRWDIFMQDKNNGSVSNSTSLRKHTYSNILKILPPKNENSDIFHISALSRNKKNNVYPYKPQFYYMKVGFKGVKII